MSSMNSLAEKFKKRRNVGVTTDGKISATDPRSNGKLPPPSGMTTLEPKRFF